jgi:hypothetical protein
MLQYNVHLTVEPFTVSTEWDKIISWYLQSHYNADGWLAPFAICYTTLQYATDGGALHLHLMFQQLTHTIYGSLSCFSNVNMMFNVFCFNYNDAHHTTTQN